MKMISHSLTETSQKLLQFAGGNLNIEISPKLLSRKDEIGEISNSVLQVRDYYRSVLQGIHKTADNLCEFSSEFSQFFSTIVENIAQCTNASDAIAQGAHAQAIETQNSNMDITNLYHSIEKTSANVVSLEERSNKMKGSIINAQSILDELIAINTRTTSSFAVVREMSTATNNSVKEITQQCTERTHQMLSLSDYLKNSSSKNFI